MIRQAFRKVLAFAGLTASVAVPTGSTSSVRLHRDTSLPRPRRTRRNVPHGRMRLFRSFKTA